MRLRSALIWLFLALALGLPLVFAGLSPFIAWREPVYIASSFAGIAALGMLLLQPLLIAGLLPGLHPLISRRVHRDLGFGLTLAVVIHVVFLWITSPPDVVDALLLVSPTPFSIWGVLAMWAVIISVLIVALKRPLKLRPTTWRKLHVVLAIVIAAGTVAHALLIEGLMENLTKILLCFLVALAVLKVGVERWGSPIKQR